MSEMIERVAEAIWQSESVRADRGPRRVSWADAGPPTWDKYRPLARAAIEAMRKPTEEMVSLGARELAGEDKWNRPGDLPREYIRIDAGEVYDAMLDEALR